MGYDENDIARAQKDGFKSHIQDVLMTELRRQEKIYDAGYSEGEKAGYEKGYEAGYHNGFQESADENKKAFENGRSAGFSDGLKTADLSRKTREKEITEAYQKGFNDGRANLVKPHWIVRHENGTIDYCCVCSRCKKVSPGCEKWFYCPNCGAEMEDCK